MKLKNINKSQNKSYFYVWHLEYNKQIVNSLNLYQFKCHNNYIILNIQDQYFGVLISENLKMNQS